MIRCNGTVLLLGYGAIGRSFFSILCNEIKNGNLDFDLSNFYVIDRVADNRDEFVSLGGCLENFNVQTITRENYSHVFSTYLKAGDTLIDLSTGLGNNDFVSWCAEHNIMLMNSCNSQWEEEYCSHYGLFKDVKVLAESLKERPTENIHPILLQMGANPGLISSFVLKGLEYIVEEQKKDDEIAKTLLEKRDYANLAKHLKVRIIHSSDKDTQEAKIEKFDKNTLYNTWSPYAFYIEATDPSETMIGTHEDKDKIPNVSELLGDKYVIHSKRGHEHKARSYSPTGEFVGTLVPHEEVITIADFLSTDDYSPTVAFVYSPMKIAQEFIEDTKRHNYAPEPKSQKVLYDELTDGTEYVGAFIMGEDFTPVWVGNNVGLEDARKFGRMNTPTILQVSAGMLAGFFWMCENKNKKGLFYPENVDPDYIIKISERYIGKTQFITVSSEDFSIDKFTFDQFLVK